MASTSHYFNRERSNLDSLQYSGQPTNSHERQHQVYLESMDSTQNPYIDQRPKLRFQDQHHILMDSEASEDLPDTHHNPFTNSSQGRGEAPGHLPNPKEFKLAHPSRVFLKGIDLEKLEKVTNGELHKLDDEKYEFYVRISPRKLPKSVKKRKKEKTPLKTSSRRSHQKQTRGPSTGDGSHPQQSSSSRGRPKRGGMSFVEFDSSYSLIKSIVKEIDSIVGRLDTRADKIRRTYDTSKQRSKLRAESPEIKSLRKRTVELLQDGEELLARVARMKDEPGAQESVIDQVKSLNNLNNESDLRKVLILLRKKLRIYIEFLRNLLPKEPRNVSRNQSKSRETLKKGPGRPVSRRVEKSEKRANLGRRGRERQLKTSEKFERVETQLNSILDKLNHMKSGSSHSKKRKKKKNRDLRDSRENRENRDFMQSKEVRDVSEDRVRPRDPRESRNERELMENWEIMEFKKKEEFLKKERIPAEKLTLIGRDEPQTDRLAFLDSQRLSGKPRRDSRKESLVLAAEACKMHKKPVIEAAMCTASYETFYRQEKPPLGDFLRVGESLGNINSSRKFSASGVPAAIHGLGHSQTRVCTHSGLPINPENVPNFTNHRNTLQPQINQQKDFFRVNGAHHGSSPETIKLSLPHNHPQNLQKSQNELNLANFGNAPEIDSFEQTIERPTIQAARLHSLSSNPTSPNPTPSSEFREKEQKLIALLRLQRSLNGILKTSALLKQSEPGDEILEVQIRQSLQSIHEFMSNYALTGSKDQMIKNGVLIFQKMLIKAQGLINECSLFDSSSKQSFLEGIGGLLGQSTVDLLRKLKKGEKQYKDLLPSSGRTGETFGSSAGIGGGTEGSSADYSRYSSPGASKSRVSSKPPSALKNSKKRSKRSRKSSKETPCTKKKSSGYKNALNGDLDASLIQKDQKQSETVSRHHQHTQTSTQLQSTQRDSLSPAVQPKTVSEFKQVEIRVPAADTATAIGPKKTRLSVPPEGFRNTSLAEKFSHLAPKDQKVDLTPTKPKKPVKTLLPIKEGQGSITVLKLIDDTHCAIGFTSGDLLFYNTETRTAIYGYKEHNSAISTIEVATIALKTPLGVQSQRILLTGGSESECSILVWNIDSMQPLKRLSGHQHLISSIVDLEDCASVATSSFDTKVAIWDLSETFSCIQLLEDINSPIICLDFHKDDQILSAGALDGTVSMWKVFYQGGFYHGCALRNKLRLSGHVIEISRSLSLSNQLITLESDFAVRVYDVSSGRLLKIFKGVLPFIDFVMIERPGGRKPLLYCLDNCNDVHKFENWEPDGQLEFSEAVQPRDMSKAVAYIKQFFGYSPKSEVLIRREELFMLSADQSDRNLVLQKLQI